MKDHSLLQRSPKLSTKEPGSSSSGTSLLTFQGLQGAFSGLFAFFSLLGAPHPSSPPLTVMHQLLPSHAVTSPGGLASSSSCDELQTVSCQWNRVSSCLPCLMTLFTFPDAMERGKLHLHEKPVNVQGCLLQVALGSASLHAQSRKHTMLTQQGRIREMLCNISQVGTTE